MALCEKPYIVDGMACPCSVCDVCRIRRKRLWAHRIMLESQKHGDSCVATLTYDDEHLPKDGSVNPKDAQDFLKRLRANIYPQKIRYFLAGEYGDESWRPHYHLAIFGLSSLLATVVEKSWGLGHVHVDTLTPASASYIAGYVTKKMTKPVDALKGKHPEFTRMSLKPGIGADAMDDFADAIRQDGYMFMLENGDVPFQYRTEGGMALLGTYLRRKLRGKLGYVDEGTPQASLALWKKEMRKLLKENVTFAPHEAREVRNKKIQDYYVDKDTQKLRNVLTRAKIFAQKKSI